MDRVCGLQDCRNDPLAYTVTVADPAHHLRLCTDQTAAGFRGMAVRSHRSYPRRSLCIVRQLQRPDQVDWPSVTPKIIGNTHSESAFRVPRLRRTVPSRSSRPPGYTDQRITMRGYNARRSA
jgi:hypothetical protein